MKHSNAQYALDKNPIKAQAIANTVERVLAARYPSVSFSFLHYGWSITGQDLHILRFSALKLNNPLIRDILNTAAGAIDTAKMLVK
jgi:hypothetical protein